VKTAKSGAVLLTGDLWHPRESRERHLVPSFNTSREQTLESMRRVEALARASGARVIRQHVPDDFAALPTFPAPLE
jgi:N-acyl homoserine lactone hydrolase